MVKLWRPLVVLGLFLSLFSNSGCGPSGNSGSNEAAGRKVTINGGGATFVQPMMQEWTAIYRDQTKGKVQIDYQGVGSGAGVDGLINKTFAFGCSDAPLNKEQLEKAKSAQGEVLHVPLVIGAVVIPYNVPGINAPLHFSGEIISEIYLGKITKWNDAKLKALNPNVNLPDLGIVPVFRADKSGTSAIFSEFLSKSNPEFKKTVGTSTKPSWPSGLGIGQTGSDGVAGHVTRSEGAIGYVELFFALKNKIPFGTVRNTAGKDITPTEESIKAAAEASLKEKQTMEPYSLHELTYSLTNAGGEKSYPISGLSYAIIFKQLPADKGPAILEFLKWATKEGQEHAKTLDYSPLPESLTAQIHEQLGKVTISK